MGTGFQSTKTKLLYTGTGNYGIRILSSNGVKLNNLLLGYTSSSFTGSLVETGWSSAGTDCMFLAFDRCVFVGAGGITSAARFLLLGRTIMSTIDRCFFTNAQRAIEPAHYANAIGIYGSTFVNTVQPPIYNPCQAWTIDSCTFEPRIGALAGAVETASNHIAFGLSYRGNWHGDVGAAGGNWLGVRTIGAQFSGNFFAGAGGSGHSIGLYGGSEGVYISGNRFESPISAIGATVLALAVVGNSFGPGVANGVLNTGNVSRYTSLSNWGGNMTPITG